MTERESLWLREALQRLTAAKDISPLLNVGSSTKHFREVEQPWNYQNIIGPLESKGIKVTHLDIKDAEGVDIVGDLSDPLFLARLKQRKYKSVLCTNLLEHVPNPQEICSAMLQVVEKEGYLIIGVPNLYPYHNDPIDNMFRPDAEELHGYFPGTELIESELVHIGRSHFSTMIKSPKMMLVFTIRLLTPFYKPSAWVKIIKGVPDLFKEYRILYAIFRKN